MFCAPKHLCTCMHAFMHLSTHTYIHPYIHASIHTYVRRSIHPYIHTCIRTYIHVLHTDRQTDSRTCTLTCMYDCMYVYVCMYVCMHVRMYACMQTQQAQQALSDVLKAKRLVFRSIPWGPTATCMTVCTYIYWQALGMLKTAALSGAIPKHC